MTTQKNSAAPANKAKKVLATPEQTAPAEVVVAVTPATAPITEPKTPANPAPKAKVVAPAVEDLPASTIEDHGKVKKAKKPKLIRDSFTIPQDEYGVIDELKARCMGAGVAIKKSELLRAGLLALQALSDKKLMETVGTLEKIKTGRPAK